MTQRIVHTFRGMRTLAVLKADDPNTGPLVQVLDNLGLDTTVCPPDDGSLATAAGLRDAELVLFDGDTGLGPALTEALPAAPRIALIGLETPSRLSRLVQLRVAAHIVKPVRSSGVFSAVFLAVNETATRHRESHELHSARARLRDRRLVFKAMLRLMNTLNLDDDEAYGLLRRESMRRRISVESMSRIVLDRDAEGQETPHTLTQS